MPDQYLGMSRGASQKRATPSGGFLASPVPSKLRDNTPRTGRRAHHDDGRAGSRLFSMTESVVRNRRGSVGTDFTARGHQSAAAVRNGLARGAVLGKDKVHTVLATGDVPAEVWNALQSFGERAYALSAHSVLQYLLPLMDQMPARISPPLAPL